MSRGMFKNNNVVQNYRAPQDSLPVVCVLEVDIASFVWLRHLDQLKHDNYSFGEQTPPFSFELFFLRSLPFVFVSAGLDVIISVDAILTFLFSLMQTWISREQINQ